MKFLNPLFILVCLFMLSGCSDTPVKNSEWVPLFNGIDIDDWVVKIKRHEVGDNFGDTFRVEDGMIIVRYDQYGEFNEQFGHLYYKTPYSHFHLKLEYRLSGEFYQGAPDYAVLNSGLMFHSQDPYTILKDQNWPISVEMQFLAGLGDGKPRPTGNMCSPGSEIIYTGEMFPEHCLNSSSPTISANQWVRAEVIVRGNGLITHIINDEVVLEYSTPTIGGINISGYDPKLFIVGKPLTEGYIALQSEGQPIEFRNIMIKALN